MANESSSSRSELNIKDYSYNVDSKQNEISFDSDLFKNTLNKCFDINKYYFDIDIIEDEYICKQMPKQKIKNFIPLDSVILKDKYLSNFQSISIISFAFYYA